MDIAIVGLGRMGSGIARRWLAAGHRVVGFDTRVEALSQLTPDGLTLAASLPDLVDNVPRPRFIWLMLPTGEPTRSTAAALSDLLDPDDILTDGGNTNFHESAERASELADRGVHFLDVGTSAGIWGFTKGFCLMIGGSKAVFEEYEEVFACLTPPGGYAHVGPSGAGHYTKMVHNGIEYALLQAYAEGFEILSRSGYELDLPQTAELWRHGSLIQSWLLDMLASKLARDPNLDQYSDYVEDLGTGRWAVLEAIDTDTPAPAITMALLMRLRSRQPQSFSGKVVSALREDFGGHVQKRP